MDKIGLITNYIPRRDLKYVASNIRVTIQNTAKDRWTNQSTEIMRIYGTQDARKDDSQ